MWYPIPPFCLDGPRLVGVHNEIHSICSVICNSKKGYSNHPEVHRWRGHLAALAVYHDAVVQEAHRRGWRMGQDHKTPMPYEGPVVWPGLIEPIDAMREKLASKIGSRL